MMLVLSGDERSALRSALDCLERGDERGFRDQLWLGFGETWSPTLDRLVDAGYVEEDSATHCDLTERGVALLGRLRLGGGVRGGSCGGTRGG